VAKPWQLIIFMSIIFLNYVFNGGGEGKELAENFCGPDLGKYNSPTSLLIAIYDILLRL
jgi:hypothetical protein